MKKNMKIPSVESSLTVKESFLTVKESFYTVKESFYTIKESFYTVKESFYTLEESFYTVKDIFYNSKNYQIQPSSMQKSVISNINLNLSNLCRVFLQSNNSPAKAMTLN